MTDLPPPRPRKKKSSKKPPKKKGLSTGAIIALSLGGVAFLSLAVCCGGAYYLFSNAMEIAEKPEDIEAMRETIADIDIPEEYKPQAGFKLSVGFSMKMVAYGRTEETDQSGLILMEMNIPGQQSDEDLRSRFESELDENRQQGEIVVDSQEIKTVIIDGKEVEFEFITGHQPESEKIIHQVIGLFDTRGGKGFLMLFEDDENWNEEDVLKMLNSISAQ